MQRAARRLGFAVVGLLGLGLCAVIATAQNPDPGNKVITKASQFKLPVSVDDDLRVKLLELKLYVRNPEGVWSCAETAPPTTTHFTFNAQKDGEYRFTFVTVDRSGRINPTSLDAQPPHRIVVVDTTPPELTVKPLTAVNRETFLQVIQKDAHPDASTIRMSYRNSRGSWQYMDLAQPDRPGTYRVPGPLEQLSFIRVQASDSVGNFTSRDFDVRSLGSPEKAPAPEAPKIEMGLKPEIARPAPSEPMKIPSLGDPPPSNRFTKADELNLTPVVSNKPVEPLAALESPMLIETRPLEPTLNLTRPVEPKTIPSKPPESLVENSLPPVRQPMVTEQKPVPLAPEGSPASPATTNFINTSKCSLNYAIDNVDAANVKPEFWATRDGGRNWQRLLDESQGRSPAKLELPSEGLYGIAIRTSQNNQAPTPADRPDCWIEVDTSKPFVNLLEPTLGKDSDVGTLLIFWTAHDKNLNENSINIWYASRPEGPWLSVIANHKNEGVYRWILPQGMGPQIFLRMEATDLANNVGRVELRKPVQLETVQPKVRVISVAPVK
jgi:hypothetical protein